MNRLRWGAGRAYSRIWRSSAKTLEQVAPRSAREQQRRPRLPAEPFSRKYGMPIGTPVDRLYIESFLERNASDIRGAVLEVLDPSYTHRFGGESVTRADVLDASPDAPQTTVRGNLETGEGLSTETYDCFICTQTLSLIYDVKGALGHARSLLRPDGVLLVSVPGISQQADPDAEEFPDYWRFTKRSLRRLLEDEFGPAQVQVEAHGTVAVAASFLYGIPADQVDPSLLTPHDPDYEMVICGRAVNR
jgi:hypothetical protein